MIGLPVDPRRRRALALALFAAIASGAFFRLGSDRVYPKSEARCSEVVAEMDLLGRGLGRSLVPGKQLHYVLGLVHLFAVVGGRRIAAPSHSTTRAV